MKKQISHVVMHALVALISAYIYTLVTDPSVFYAAIFTAMIFIESVLTAFASAFLLDGTIEPWRMKRWLFRFTMVVRGLFLYSLMTVDIGGWQSIALKIVALLVGIAYVINTNIEHNRKVNVDCVPPPLPEPTLEHEYPDNEDENDEE